MSSVAKGYQIHYNNSSARLTFVYLSIEMVFGINKMHSMYFIGFESLGCWRDAWSRSLPTLEGEHYLLMDPNYKGRRHALFKCARAALDKGYNLFGIENGGQCFASADEDKGYHKYGASKECKGKTS